MCYVVCSPLQALLEQVYGLDCDLVEGRIDLPTEPLWGHYWIAHEDQIIDPTASQFYDAHGQRVPEVYIGDLPDHYIELHRL